MNSKTVIAGKEEIESLLNYFKKTRSLKNQQYYLIYRILIETGMKKEDLKNIDYGQVDLERKYIKTIVKTGRVIYYISDELSLLLKEFIEERKQMKVDTKALFVSRKKKDLMGDLPIND